MWSREREVRRAERKGGAWSSEEGNKTGQSPLALELQEEQVKEI